jgi:hypothetical protein
MGIDTARVEKISRELGVSFDMALSMVVDAEYPRISGRIPKSVSRSGRRLSDTSTLVRKTRRKKE